MRDFHAFRECLSCTKPSDLVRVAAKLLQAPVDWSHLVRNHLESLPDEDLIRLVLRANIARLQPRVFMIDEIPGRFQIVVHHFDLPIFERYIATNEIGPHYHSFSFSTRILRGQYTQCLFFNDGTLGQPDLEFDREVCCRAGDVYTLSYDRYHCVTNPQHESLTLMVRGPAVYNPCHPPEEGYGSEQVLIMRSRILAALSGAGPGFEGRILDIGPGTRTVPSL